MSVVETASIEPLDERGSAVRFETHCIVIPDPAHRSRRPRVVTKSYALPLWKRRASSAGPSTSAPPEDASFEEHQSHLVLRVPLPTLSLKHHAKADHTPLPPCLVHRPRPSASGSSCASTPSLPRDTRPSRKHSPSPSRTDIVTVPLRPCCAACQSVTEAALAGGDAWSEHLSRAALRRHSMSADGRPRTITVAGSAAAASYGTLGVSISVDEIDKRRRSSDTGPSTTSRETLWFDKGKAREEFTVPLVLRRTSASSSSVTLPSPHCRPPATPRIPEEEDDEHQNENELFPLPSPKRSPTTSPTPSPAGSLSSLAAGQASQGCSTPSTCSGDSASKQHFLAPPPCSSSSSLSLPKFSESTTDLMSTEDPPRAPSPSLLSTLPSLSGRLCSRSPSPRLSLVPPTPTDVLFPATEGTPPETAQSSAPAPASIATPSSLSPPQPSSSSYPRFPWRSRRSASADVLATVPSPGPSAPRRTPSASPTLSTFPNAKKTFSMASPRAMFADVLRGVGAMGSTRSGMGLGV